MKKYYVNEVRLYGLHDCYSDWDHRYIGLFTENNWHGEGNFCGWYGAEYYTNTILIAFYESVSSGGEPHSNDGKGALIRCNEYFDEVAIGSCYWKKVILAEDDEDTIAQFKGIGNVN